MKKEFLKILLCPKCRSKYIFEVEPFNALAIDTLGNKPIVLKGNYTNFQYQLSLFNYKFLELLKKLYSKFKK